MSLSTGEIDPLREAFAADSGMLAQGRRCPAAERLWLSAAEQLSPAEDRDLIVHLGDCGVCAANWRLARELSETTRRKSGRGRPASRRGWPAMALAASVVLAAALGLVLVPDAVQDLQVYRAPADDWMRPLPADGATLPRDAFDLRWSEGPLGTTYDVRATTEELDLLAEGLRLDSAVFRIPARSLDPLADGTRVAWQVTAYLPDGGRAESESFIFVIGSRGP